MNWFTTEIQFSLLAEISEVGDSLWYRTVPPNYKTEYLEKMVRTNRHSFVCLDEGALMLSSHLW